MMSDHPALIYQQAVARGASPIGQVVALYDTILRDFVRALAALQAGDIETRIFETNHALLVIGHLLSVLDYNHGGAAARQLDQFYIMTCGMTVQANIQASTEPFEQLIDLYAQVRQAWHLVDQQVPADQQKSAVPVPPGKPTETGSASPADEDMETSRLQWSV